MVSQLLTLLTVGREEIDGVAEMASHTVDEDEGSPFRHGANRS